LLKNIRFAEPHWTGGRGGTGWVNFSGFGLNWLNLHFPTNYKYDQINFHEMLWLIMKYAKWPPQKNFCLKCCLNPQLGRRERSSYCQNLSGFFGFFVTLGCKTSVILIFASTLCIPEISLYLVKLKLRNCYYSRCCLMWSLLDREKRIALTEC
jgi:hypothetical protein